MSANKAIALVNTLGRGLEATGIRPGLRNARELIAANRVDDRDELRLETALDRLLGAYREDAGLTLVGRAAIRGHVGELLGNLARLQQFWKRCDAIDDERVDAPVFITGLPRTGSTLLQALLAQDPENRTPASWEVMRPPTARDQQKKNVRYCRRRLNWARLLAPRFQAIHAVGATRPEECIAITAYVFRSIVFHTTKNVPSYQDWLERSDQRIAYRFHRRFLQHLQYLGTAGRWVLKAPGHMFGIRALAAVYPDAVVVQTHRDPLRVAASLASHTTVLRSAFSDRIDRREIAGDWLERWWRANDELLDFRDRSEMPQVDVYYSDLMRDPLAAVRDLYARIGWKLTPDAQRRMAAYLAANPKGKYGKHLYSLEEFGLDGDTILDRLAQYRSRYPIQPEPP